jgi:hypothetical protein
MSGTRDPLPTPGPEPREPAGNALAGADTGATTAEGESWGPGDTPQVDGAVGRTLGDYVILERLGTGGMGVVYRAFQRDARRLVALKLMKTEWWDDSTVAGDCRSESRFRNEARALAQLEHDHIVPIYDVGHADSVVYFSMRLIKGRSLSRMIRQDGPLDPRRAAAYIEPIARAVQYAHDRGVLHRDLKPSNIMVDEDDRPYLIDLGLCKSLDATDATSVAGRPMGTAEFMSPEQARGDRDVGAAADVYGLGATLLTLLTGSPPFSGPSPVVILRRVLDDEPDWPRERDRPVGRELKAICLKCLEKQPSRRFRSAGELAEALRRYLDDEPTGVVVPGPGTRLSRWVRRQPWRAAAAGLALIAGLIAATAWAHADRRDRQLAAAFVRDLPTISWDDLPRKVREMAGHRGRVEPALHARLADGPADPELRSRIALALVAVEPWRAAELVDRLLICGPEEHRAIRDVLRPSQADVASRLRAPLDDPGPDFGRCARAATAMIAFDAPDRPEPFAAAGPAWAILRAAVAPDARVELLDWLVRSRIDPAILAARLRREPDASARRSLIQVLAELGCDARPPAAISPALPARLAAIYRDDPDPGTHSSLAYLFLLWGLNADRERADIELAGKPPGHRRWFVNTIGQTFAVVGPVEPCGDPPSGTTRAGRLAIATTETTLKQYGWFDPDHAARVRRSHGASPPDPGAPVGSVSFDQAARFCNWLSEREGLPPAEWCFLPGDEPGTMVPAPDYLSRRGYRLPSLREWEYAARSGTATDRYFGGSLRHASAYAWSNRNTDNHAEPVGRKRPNDYGLFDVLGNLLEWCYNPDPPREDRCDRPVPGGADCRKIRLVSVRGGSYSQPEGGLTVVGYSPTLDRLYADEALRYIGFRVARTEP